jgi:hypothetical protein
MNRFRKLTTFAVLFSASQAGFALTPWNDGTPDIIVYGSGGPALDAAFAKIVENTLAAKNSVDTFSDVSTTGTIGGRWQAFYFTGNRRVKVVASH